MFFLIPIGSEEGVRRLPFFTIGLIALNSIIWIITSIIFNAQVNELEKLNNELFEIERIYLYKIIEQDPNILMTQDYNQIREQIKADEIIPYDSEHYAKWSALYEKYKNKQSNMIFEQLGFKSKKFDALKIFTSMFVHANFFHLLFNMLFLWLVGCNIEDDWTWKAFLGLYLVSGIVATLFHVAAFPKSDVPLIGASGAIAGIMGAFMIRHYKTKIRIAYFIWFIIVRPFFGTFAIYAGIVLPLWFLQQILGASWSLGETGTAYQAHIGGFVFGAAIGVILKFLGVEEKYIEPMVEDSFEKLKASPKLKEAYKKLDAGDTAGALPLFLAVVSEEPENCDAPLFLARIYTKMEDNDQALLMYNKALTIALRIQDDDVISSIYEEIEEKNLVQYLSEKNIYNLAVFLEKINEIKDAVKVYGLYIKKYPGGTVRSKAIYRTYILFKEKLYEETMAQSALAFLKKEYPDFPIS